MSTRIVMISKNTFDPICVLYLYTSKNVDFSVGEILFCTIFFIFFSIIFGSPRLSGAVHLFYANKTRNCQLLSMSLEMYYIWYLELHLVIVHISKLEARYSIQYLCCLIIHKKYKSIFLFGLTIFFLNCVVDHISSKSTFINLQNNCTNWKRKSFSTDPSWELNLI